MVKIGGKKNCLNRERNERDRRIQSIEESGEWRDLEMSGVAKTTRLARSGQCGGEGSRQTKKAPGAPRVRHIQESPHTTDNHHKDYETSDSEDEEVKARI
jgi:hypothetical protein